MPPLLPLLQAHLEHAEAMSEGRRADDEVLRGVVAAADEAKAAAEAEGNGPAVAAVEPAVPTELAPDPPGMGA